MLERINIIVVETYRAVEQSIYNAEREARRELRSALLRGQPADEQAARADTPLSERYTVLGIHIDSDDQPASVADLLARRRIRIMHRTAHRTAAIDTLATRRVAGITAHRDHLEQGVRHSIGIVTALTPHIG